MCRLLVVAEYNNSCRRIFVSYFISYFIQVAASPEHIQGLYGVPSRGHDASHTDSASHSGADHIDAEGRDVSSQGQSNLFSGARSPAQIDEARSRAQSDSKINLAPSTQELFLDSNRDSKVAANFLNPDKLEKADIEEPLGTAVTLTEESTVDVFTTLVNVFYNTVPVTLTEFVKTTYTSPTVQVSGTNYPLYSE